MNIGVVCASNLMIAMMYIFIYFACTADKYSAFKNRMIILLSMLPIFVFMQAYVWTGYTMFMILSLLSVIMVLPFFIQYVKQEWCKLTAANDVLFSEQAITSVSE